MLLLAVAPRHRRRAAALALTGAIAVASVAGFRDAVVRWAGSRTTFDDFWGEDTLIAQAASRWDAYGMVALDPELGQNPLTIAGVRKYRLDPGRDAGDARREATGIAHRRFRIVAPETGPGAGERLVERVSDPWGREWARVYASRR